MDSRSCELESVCARQVLYSPSGSAICNKRSSSCLQVVELARCLCSDVRCLQRAMKHVQGAHCSVYGLLLFQVVSSFLEQFPRTLDEYSFRLRDTIGEFGRVELANGGFVELSPISVLKDFVRDSVHAISVAVTLGRLHGGFYRRTRKLLGHNGSLCSGCQIVARNRQPTDAAERC